jgi:serine/threonine protein kinase
VTRPVITPGRLVAGRYRLQDRIGGGGMGAVWKARDELLGRTVAIKQVLPPAEAKADEAEEQRQRALREGRIAARLSNPHAIAIYDVAVDGGQPWLVMEYLPSRSLAAVLEEDGLLRVDQVAQIGAQVADALAATHAAGIVHRDVKPANILIGRGDRVEGLVKITDFGISHASGDVTLTQTGQITGTPAFLSPEVAQGEEPGPAGDVFSLGATLYTCLEGQPPFGMGDNALQQLYRVAGGQIIPPRRCGELTGSLLRMLSADPGARPAMVQVRDELARLVAGRDGDTTTVLLARTDLRSGPRGTLTMPAPDRDRAREPEPAAEPVPAPAAEAVPAPMPEPAPEPPRARAPVAAPEPATRAVREDDGPRRRRALLWVTAVVLVALLAVGGVLLLTSRNGGGTARQAAGSASGTSAPASSPASPGPTETSSPPATTSAVAAGALRAQDVRDFLTRYHGLLPGDPRSAWALTGPTLRSSISEDNYVAFWQQFSAVSLTGVQAQDGSLVATGTLQFTYRNGGQQAEQHQFTLVRGDGGQLLLDSDRAVG